MLKKMRMSPIPSHVSFVLNKYDVICLNYDHEKIMENNIMIIKKLAFIMIIKTVITIVTYLHTQYEL